MDHNFCIDLICNGSFLGPIRSPAGRLSMVTGNLAKLVITNVEGR